MKIITLNINGLKTKTRQDYLNNFITDENPDILSLQETNISETSFLNSNYQSIINENVENRIAGTILIYKKNLNILDHEKSPDGRIIRAVFQGFIIVSIYAPTQKESASTRRNFFLNELPNFIKASDQNLILNGDFNSIIKPIDREGSDKKLNGPLKYLIEKLNLVDCFRCKHPSEISYTFICPNGKSRIDKMFIPKSLESNIISIIHKPYIFSDHLSVILNFISPKSSPKKHRKRAKWKLNTSILEDKAFKEITETFCLEAKQAKSTFKNTLLWWEKYVKQNFKSLAINYSIEKRSLERKLRDFNQKCLDQKKRN